MSRAVLSPGTLRGELTVPPSKSAAHRALLCAALSGGRCRVRNLAPSEDIRATADAVRAMGRRVEWDGGCLEIGPGAAPARADINCRESGSTLRFLIPVLSALGIDASYTGEGRLPQRPIGCYLTCLPENGAVLETAGGLPLTVSGKLRAGTYRLPGDVSSQFITGLLLALPLLSGDSDIVLTTPLESSGYVDMTLAVMEDFGVAVTPTETGWHVPGGQRYLPRDYTVEGDWSQAAFFLAAGALGGELSLRGLRRDSRQGDRAAETLFSRFGAKLAWTGGVLTVSPGPLRGFSIDASQIPDLVPILAVTAALSEGRTSILRAGRLRIKESDRLSAMAQGLSRLGARIEELPDGLEIDGVPALSGGEVSGFRDHRVVMSLAVAALRAQGDVTVTDAESVSKSYPNFFQEYQKLGGIVNVINMG